MPRLEALTTGQLLDRIFTLYRKHFALFFAIAIIPQLSRVLLFVPWLPGMRGSATAIISVIAWLVVLMALGAMGQGATSVAVSDLYLDQPTSVKQSYSRVARMTLRLIGMVFGYALLVGIGFIFLIVPGVYFLLTYALAIAVMAIEKVSFSEAMTRSKDLAQGNRLRIFVIIVLSVVIQYTLFFAFIFALGVFIAFTRSAIHYPFLIEALSQTLQMLASALSMPIGLIGFTLAYYDARVRKEAFDLEYMMDSEAAALPPVPVEPIAATVAAGASGSGSAGDVVAATTGGSTFMLFDQPNSQAQAPSDSPAAPATSSTTEG